MGWKIDVEHAMSDFERMLEESEWEEFWEREAEKRRLEGQNESTKQGCEHTSARIDD